MRAKSGSNGSFITIHRKLTEWEWYKNSKMVHLFMHLLINANHKDGNWMGEKIRRGQLITGRYSLSESTGLSVQEVRTCLKRLKSTNEITIKSTKTFSVITVCKYDSYQDKNKTHNHQFNLDFNQQLTINQPSTNHQLTTNNNDNNDNNDNNVNNTTIKGTAEIFENNENEKSVLNENSANGLNGHSVSPNKRPSYTQPNQSLKPVHYILPKDYESEFMKSQIWVESLCMAHKITADDIKKRIVDFSSNNLKMPSVLTQEGKREIEDAKKHFCNWLAKTLGNKTRKIPTTRPNPFSDR